MRFLFPPQRNSWFRSRKLRHAERKSKRSLKIASRADRFTIGKEIFRGRKRAAVRCRRERRFCFMRGLRFRTCFSSRLGFRSRNLKSKSSTRRSTSRWSFEKLREDVKTRFSFKFLKCGKQKRKHELVISAPIMNTHHARIDGSVDVSNLDLQFHLNISLTVW